MLVHDEQLVEIIAQHSLWLSSHGAVGRRANLEGADMRQINLCGVNLSRAIMKDARLERADLSGSVLRETDLRGASLDFAKLRKADLTKALLSRASLNRAGLEEAHLSGANLYSATANHANFFNSNLDGAVFVQAEAEHANFRKASLRGAIFKSAWIVAADFSEAIVDCAVFERAVLDRANLFFHSRELANFELARLSDALIDSEDSDLLAASLSIEKTYCSDEWSRSDQLEIQKRQIIASRAGLLRALVLLRRLGLGLLYLGGGIFLLSLAGDAYTLVIGREHDSVIGVSYVGALGLAALASVLMTSSAFARLWVLRSASWDGFLGVDKARDGAAKTDLVRMPELKEVRGSSVFPREPENRSGEI